MTADILTFPRPFAKPRPVLTVPTGDSVVNAWAEYAARKIAYAMNPLPHNRAMFDAAEKRYLEACESEKFPA